ncbi:Peptidoglycan/xylan/chitin deacetylase, PgdA/CDA1 family [Thiohalospira halophila DSM 15071]|uniref:Peptidoglycan/xylan/chitin deacetylase, PgdA/CDA1 family n=1 Tax=Thiohalospira halophila DSM 15071 TaxID=1123397 RepID=A0A1I1QXH1_9GAMM|nr:polysaccharide deacetylase family protein [Thiohalospira halophila]SFD26789.1 Peptidoglycan/xylan/chitin deacetylase, PgdA/CDA1 family [Thiohalospira halophila DSM 15071]
MRQTLLALLLLALPLPALADAVGLIYHRFGEGKYPTTSIDLESFEAQMDHLAENDYRIWPLGKVVCYLREDRELPDKVVSITIDDAYASVYHEAFPRLQERGWPFTVFVSTDPVDRGFSNFMTWDQMREMAEAGVEFANHTRTHPYLPQRQGEESDAAWAERVTEEIAGAEKRLREELGDAVADDPGLLAYPYGDYDAATAEIVRELDHVGVAQHAGPIGDGADLRALRRFPVGNEGFPMDRFRLRVATRALPVAEVEPWDPATAEERPRVRVELEGTVEGWQGLNCFVKGQSEPAKVEWPLEGRAFTARARQPLKDGLVHYNCTARGPDGRYWWYSHLWRAEPSTE